MQKAAADAGAGQVPGLEKVTETGESGILHEAFPDPGGKIVRDVRIGLQFPFVHAQRIHELAAEIIRPDRKQGDLCNRGPGKIRDPGGSAGRQKVSTAGKEFPPVLQEMLSALRGRGNTDPGDGMRTDGTVQEAECAAVFHSKQVVGKGRIAERQGGFFLINSVNMLKRLLQGGGSRRRERHSVFETCLQKLPVGLRACKRGVLPAFRFCKHLCTEQEIVHVPALGAKAEICDDSEFFQKSDPSPGKIFGAAAGRVEGKLQDQVRPGAQDLLCPYIFVEDGGLTALHEISAHSDDDIVCPGQFSGLAQKISVPLVKGVAFHDDTCDIHTIPDFRQA